MFHVSPAGFGFFLQTPFWNNDLFLVFFVADILHCFYESCYKIGHPKHLLFVKFCFLLKFGDFSFGLSDFKNSFILERLEILIKDPAAPIFLLEISDKIWRSMSLWLCMMG